MTVETLSSDLKRNFWDREPVFAMGATQALAALIISLPGPGGVLTGAVEAGLAAVIALLVALKVEPRLPVLFTGLGTALGTLIVTFGVQSPASGAVSTVNAVLALLLAWSLREKVAPQPAGSARQAVSDLRHGRIPPAAAGDDGQMSRLASNATAAAAALARIAQDAQAMAAGPRLDAPRPRAAEDQADPTQPPA